MPQQSHAAAESVTDPAQESLCLTRRSFATACLVVFFLLFVIFGTSSMSPTRKKSGVLEPIQIPRNLADSKKTPQPKQRSKPAASPSPSPSAGSIFDSATLNPAFRCPALLDNNVTIIQQNAKSITLNQPLRDNSARCEGEECAQRWLEKCWWKSAGRHGGEQCANVKTFRHFVNTLRPPKRLHYWREGASDFLADLRSFLSNDSAITATPCAVVSEISKNACAAVSRRDLSFEFLRGDAAVAADASSTIPSLKKIRMTGRFSTDVSVSVLDAHEFQDTSAKDRPKKKIRFSNGSSSDSSNNNNEKPLPEMAARVDLFVVGMFFRSLSYAKTSWANAEEHYFSKFRFRHRHFFNWNTVRAPALRLAKGKDLYGAELLARNSYLRDEVLGGDFQTWLTLDAQFPGMSDLTTLFQHVTVLRAVGFMYLTSLDEEATRTAPYSARLVDRTLRRLSSSSSSSSSSFSAALRSAESRRLADYVVLVRPDSIYDTRYLASISRNSAGDILLASGPTGKWWKGPKRFRLSAIVNDTGGDDPRKWVLCDRDVSRIHKPHLGKVDRITDQFLVSGMVTLAHAYYSMLSMLHSCIYWPTPKYPFIEFFMVVGVREAGGVPAMVTFGNSLDRFGGETTTTPPNTPEK